jgi:hypothetical protein
MYSNAVQVLQTTRIFGHGTAVKCGRAFKKDVPAHCKRAKRTASLLSSRNCGDLGEMAFGAPRFKRHPKIIFPQKI